MPVAQLLKKGTEHAHSQTEKILGPKLSSIRSYIDYAAILKMFYGFFQPLEASIGQYVTKNILADINERRNSLFIVSDLKAVGDTTNQLCLCDDLPKINSSLEALGTMYVLEGSTLGGRMISKMLMKNRDVNFDESNLHFFNGYKESTGLKWAKFLSVVNQYEEGADVMIAAANETFTSLTQWMEKSL